MKKSEPLLGKRGTPLSIKELAWKTVRFADLCGQSHPVSFALRPVVTNRHLPRVVGLNLMMAVLVVAIFGPFSSLAHDTGGSVALVIPEKEAPLTTQETVVNPLPQMVVTQGFWLLHAGIDLSTPIGTPVRPAGLRDPTCIWKYIRTENQLIPR